MNVLRLAGWLEKRGLNSVLYCRSGSPLRKHARNSGLSTREINPLGKYGGLISAQKLAKCLHRDHVEFLLIQTNRDVLISSLAKLMNRAKPKHVFMQHMQIGRVKKDLIHTWEYGKLDAWIAPLEILADGVRIMTSLDPAKIRVIPLGMELERFTADSPNRGQAKQMLDIPENVPLIGTVGRIDRQKGQDTLIKACGSLRRKGVPVHLIMVGDQTIGDGASYAAELDHQIRNEGLTESVTRTSYMERIETAYKAMDIFVLPSHSETYGMVTIEAMASRRPVVATDAGGTPEIIHDGRTGLLVPPENADAMAEAIERLLRDEALALQLATAAQQHATDRYSHHRTCGMLEDMLEQL